MTGQEYEEQAMKHDILLPVFLVARQGRGALRRPIPAGSPGSQRGVALFIALMILVIISVLGVAAMRSSVTNARITTGIQVNTTSFQAAQSAITGAVNEMTGATAVQAGNLFTDLLMARNVGLVVIQRRCVTPSNTSVPVYAASGGCTSYMDSRGLVQAQSASIMKRTAPPAPGFNQFVNYQILVEGVGSVPGMGASHTNVQTLAVLGPKLDNEVTLNN
jgi:hypothetical protein